MTTCLPRTGHPGTGLRLHRALSRAAPPGPWQCPQAWDRSMERPRSVSASQVQGCTRGGWKGDCFCPRPCSPSDLLRPSGKRVGSTVDIFYLIAGHTGKFRNANPGPEAPHRGLSTRGRICGWLASVLSSSWGTPPSPHFRVSVHVGMGWAQGPLPKRLAQPFPNKLTLPTRLLGLGGNSWPEACFPLFSQTGTCHMCPLVTARGTAHLET